MIEHQKKTVMKMSHEKNGRMEEFYYESNHK